MPHLREIITVLAYELACVFRGLRSLSMLVLYLLGAGLVGGMFVHAYVRTMEKAEQLLPRQEAKAQQLKTWVLEELIGGDPATVANLGATPLPVIFFFWFSLLMIPLFTALMGFDVLSGELQHRTIRYFSTRVRRSSLLVGKLTAQLLVAIGITLVANVGLFFYATLRIPDFERAIGLSAMVRFWACSIPCIAAYVSLTALISVWIRRPILALSCAFIVLFSLWIIGVLCGQVPSMAFLRFALPSHYDGGLFSITPSVLIGSLAAHSGFALLFGGLAWVSLERRDI